MAPQVGLEPTTLRLTAGCSAIELLRSRGTCDVITTITLTASAVKRQSSLITAGGKACGESRFPLLLVGCDLGRRCLGRHWSRRRNLARLRKACEKRGSWYVIQVAVVEFFRYLPPGTQARSKLTGLGRPFPPQCCAVVRMAAVYDALKRIAQRERSRKDRIGSGCQERNLVNLGGRFCILIGQAVIINGNSLGACGSCNRQESARSAHYPGQAAARKLWPLIENTKCPGRIASAALLCGKPPPHR